MMSFRDKRRAAPGPRLPAPGARPGHHAKGSMSMVPVCARAGAVTACIGARGEPAALMKRGISATLAALRAADTDTRGAPICGGMPAPVPGDTLAPAGAPMAPASGKAIGAVFARASPRAPGDTTGICMAIVGETKDGGLRRIQAEH